MTLIPTIYNADTLGIRPDLIGRPIDSWAELLNPEFKGKASILDISSIGIMDAAMVCEAMGEIKYGDKGNMTKEEIDKTIAMLIEAKKAGQFRAFWKTFDESVNLMASGEVVIQSMWSPAITAVRSKGIPCVYQPLKEGYRSWGGGIGLPQHLSGLELEAAYEYINWYLSGWVGGFLMRQGYYSAVPETSKDFMTAGRVGLLVRGQAGPGRHRQPAGPGHGEGRRGARRRLVRRPHGARRLLERGHGREPRTWFASGTSSSPPDASKRSRSGARCRTSRAKARHGHRRSSCVATNAGTSQRPAWRCGSAERCRPGCRSRPCSWSCSSSWSCRS